jgi:UDP-glucose-4-epimerase GalE
MSILITGGAGYIGSHTAQLLHGLGERIVTLDNLSTGQRENARWGDFFQGDISDSKLVRHIIREHAVDDVIHLAASAHAGESLVHPAPYFANNSTGSLALLDAMIAEGVSRFVFASSCAVYGNSAYPTAHEGEVTHPVSPYGESKLATERTLPWYERAYGLKWVALRYFNVAGAGEDGLGEDIANSVRIIPRAVHSAVAEGSPLKVFGTTYPTIDGSAVRDYVHVNDIAQANLQALRFVERGEPGTVINIGSGAGVSVLQIIAAVSRQAGKEVPFSLSPERPGDAAYAVSNSSRAKELLNWAPVSSNLDRIVSSVLRQCQMRTS